MNTFINMEVTFSIEPYEEMEILKGDRFTGEYFRCDYVIVRFWQSEPFEVRAMGFRCKKDGDPMKQSNTLAHGVPSQPKMWIEKALGFLKEEVISREIAVRSATAETAPR